MDKYAKTYGSREEEIIVDFIRTKKNNVVHYNDMSDMEHSDYQNEFDVDFSFTRKGKLILCSVKTQKTASKTGNFSFELFQKDSDTGDTINGNFKQCQADRYLMHDGNETLRVFDAKVLKEKVEELAHRKVWLTVGGKAHNENLALKAKGLKKYDQAQSYLVRVEDLEPYVLQSYKVIIN